VVQTDGDAVGVVVTRKPSVDEKLLLLAFKVVSPGSGSRVQGSGFRVQGSGFRVGRFRLQCSMLMDDGNVVSHPQGSASRGEGDDNPGLSRRSLLSTRNYSSWRSRQTLNHATLNR